MTKHSPNLDLIFKALSDPTRRAFLARMADGPISVSALAEPTGFALPTVMKHLDILTSAALITTEKTGRTRMCRACPQTLAATEDWLALQRANWESQTDRLESYLATLQKGPSP
jgi:DNA-binding transcriptional ArsR family regulator